MEAETYKDPPTRIGDYVSFEIYYFCKVLVSGFTKRRQKNMTEFKDLQHAAAQMYENNESRKWLFAHTATQDEYVQVRRALKVLANFHAVQWEGQIGERIPVEMRA